MIFESSSPSLMLAAGELVRLPATSCVTILCAQGAVWVTRDGQPQDVVLSGGDSLDLRDGALTLVQAFEPSVIRVREDTARCADAAAAQASRRRRSGAKRPGPVDAGALMTSVVSRTSAAWRWAGGARGA